MVALRTSNDDDDSQALVLANGTDFSAYQRFPPSGQIPIRSG